MKYTREVIGKYDNDTIRVYQAYNQRIAAEAVKLQTFGENLNDMDKAVFFMDDVPLGLGH